MESKDELKEIDIKNRTCYYFDDVMRTWDTDNDTSFSGILLDENILIYDISSKTSTGAKPLRFRYGRIKQMNLLKFIIKLDIQYYLLSGVIKFVIGLNIL